MILLLDAHVVLWTVAEPSQLAPEARRAIEDPANDVIVSAASTWELEIKRASGRLRFDVDLIAELARLGIAVVPITADDAIDAGRLPLHHRDPFDRMLIAQTRRLGAVVVTRDPAFDRYEVDRLAA